MIVFALAYGRRIDAIVLLPATPVNCWSYIFWTIDVAICGF
jgi:hypothetical protein